MLILTILIFAFFWLMIGFTITFTYFTFTRIQPTDKDFALSIAGPFAILAVLAHVIHYMFGDNNKPSYG